MKSLIALISQGWDYLFKWLAQFWTAMTKINAKWWAMIVGILGIAGDIFANASNVVSAGVTKLAAITIPHQDMSIWATVAQWTSLANTVFPLQEVFGMMVTYLTIRIGLVGVKMSLKFWRWLAGVSVRAFGWGS